MRSPEQIEAFCQAAREHWRSHGSRHTEVRDVICHSIARAESPLTAEELLAESRKEDRVISLASVYRTLSDLEQAKLLRAVPGPGEMRCYVIAAAGGGGAVANIVCTDCSKVVPMTDECLPLREGFLAKQLGFKPEKMNLRIEASCEELRQHGACERRKGSGA